MNNIIKVIDCHIVYWEGDIPQFLAIKRSPNERYPLIWQCVTGSVKSNEKAYHAAQREVEEETGLAEEDLNFIWESKSWFFYDVPKERRNNYFIGKNKFIGQRQKWFLAEIKSGHEKNINLSKNLPIEFDDFIWVTYWYPLREVVSFKKEVYRELLIELLPKYIEVKK